MNFGRVGAISAATRKRRADQYLSGQSDDIELTEKQLHHAEKMMRELSRDQKSLVMYKVPVFIWGLGILFILLSLYLLYNLIWGAEGKLFKTKEAKWWQYLIALFILSIGIAFLFAIKREKLVVNKQVTNPQSQKDEIILCYKNILCQQKVLENKVSNLANMRMVKRGMESIQNKTIHYVIILSFKDGQFFEILEGKNDIKIKRQFVQIAQYINYQYTDLTIIDESVSAR